MVPVCWSRSPRDCPLRRTATVSIPATAQRRVNLRHARIVNVPERVSRAKLELGIARPAAESLVLAQVGNETFLGCRRCSEVRCVGNENYKEYCACTEDVV